MSEEKLKKFKRLLEAARAEYFAIGAGDESVKALGQFVLEAAVWDTLVIKDTTGGYTVEVEV